MTDRPSVRIGHEYRKGIRDLKKHWKAKNYNEVMEKMFKMLIEVDPEIKKVLQSTEFLKMETKINELQPIVS